MKALPNTDPYYIVRVKNRERVAERQTMDEATAECLRMNQAEAPRNPDGSIRYDLATYVVEHRPEYKYVDEA